MQSQQPISPSNIAFPPKYNIKLNLTLLALYIVTQAIPASSFNNSIIYLHEKYKHKGYGQTYLSVSSVSLIFAFIFGPYILRNISKRINVRIILSLCSIGIMINFIVPALFSIPEIDMQDENIQPPSLFRYIMEIIANIIGGFPQGLIGILQGVILTSIFSHIQEKKGKYFSFYNLIANTRALLASLVTIFALGLGHQTIYYFTLSIIALLSIFIAYFCIGFADKGKEEEIPQFKVSCFTLLLKQSIKMKNFLLFMAYQGLMMGIVSASLPHLLPEPTSDNESDKNIGIVMFFMCIGWITGGYINGFIFDRLEWKKAGNIGLIIFILTSLTQIYFLSTQKSLVKTCILGVLFGISLGYTTSFLMIMITVYFNGSLQSFAIYRLTRLISYAIYPWIATLVSSYYQMSDAMIAQSIFLIILGIISYVIMNSYNPTKQQITQNYQQQLKQQIDTQNQTQMTNQLKIKKSEDK